MKERNVVEREGKVSLNGETVEVMIIDGEDYWPGVGRVPNHDKITIVYNKKDEKVPIT